MLDGVGKLENTSLDLSLISDVNLLVVSSNHGGLDLGSSDDGRENRSRSIVSGETSLYHTGSVVNNESSFFIFFSHFEFLVSLGELSLDLVKRFFFVSGSGSSDHARGAVKNEWWMYTMRFLYTVQN